MLRIDPEIVDVSIVVLGDFNPAIFSPRWFSSNDLIREADADRADLRVVHQEVADFTADWLRIQATRDRFVAATSQAPFVRLRDLVHGVFHECLFHTPLRAFGINYSVQFLVDSMETRDRLRTTLVPLEPWRPWRERMCPDGRHGGMTSLQVSLGRPDDRNQDGQINVLVKPSHRTEAGSDTRMFVSINDHFAGDGDAEQLMRTLVGEFDASLSQSEEIVNHIMTIAQPEG